MARRLRFWAIAFVLAATPAALQSAQPRIAIGYIPVFKGLAASSDHPTIDRYSHINLSFANPAADGSFVSGDELACMPDHDAQDVKVADLARTIAAIRSRGAKVLLSLGGGVIPGCSGDWNALLADRTRPVVVANLVALVERLRLDGLDIDLEGELLTAIDRSGHYVPFIAELRAATDAKGLLLTCATASYDGGMIPVASIPYFDFVNVMSYDSIGPSWGRAGDEHSTLASARRDLALWRQRGVARDRLVLGIPFYGYGFGRYPSNLATADILDRYPEASGDVVGKRCAGCDYVTFNGKQTLRAKGELARSEAAGVMVWEITQDTAAGDLIDTVAPRPRERTRHPAIPID